MLFYYQTVTFLLVTCAAAADVGLHVDATAYAFQILSVTWRDHEWASQTKNGQRGYGVGRSVFWGWNYAGYPKQAKVANFRPQNTEP